MMVKKDWKEDIKECWNMDCKHFDEKEDNHCKLRWDTKKCSEFIDFEDRETDS